MGNGHTGRERRRSESPGLAFESNGGGMQNGETEGNPEYDQASNKDMP